MKGNRIPYSEKELHWIEARAQNPRRETHAAFVEAFGRTDVSLTNFNALCKRKGWFTGRNGRFVKGQVSHNKGKPMPTRGRMAETQFKPGRLPHNHRGAGHERICKKEGYVILIVDEVNPWTGAATRPVHKHRWMWEKANGPLPKDHALKCLDGDKTNCDPANWVAIPRAILPRLNGRFGRDFEAAPPEVKTVLLNIAKLEHAVREKGKASRRSSPTDAGNSV